MKLINFVFFIMMISLSFNLLDSLYIVPIGGNGVMSYAPQTGGLPNSDFQEGVCVDEESLICKLELSATSMTPPGAGSGTEDGFFVTAKLLLKGITSFTDVFLNSVVFVGDTYDKVSSRFVSEDSFTPKPNYSKHMCLNSGYEWSESTSQTGFCFDRSASVLSTIKPYIIWPIYFLYIMAIIQLLSGRSFNSMD